MNNRSGPLWSVGKVFAPCSSCGQQTVVGIKASIGTDPEREIDADAARRFGETLIKYAASVKGKS